MSFVNKLVNEQRERLLGAGREGDWRRVSAQLVAKTGAMVIRGSLLKPRFHRISGVPLIGQGVRIRNPQFISAGRDLVVEDYAEVQGLSIEGIVFGDLVSIGSFALIRPSSYYSRDIGVGLKVGDRSSIGPNSYIGCSGGISIGEDVMLGPGVRLFSEDHNMSDVSISIKRQGVAWKPIRIDDGCWIASGVTVTGGVHIHKGAVVAAGAVVTKDVAAGEIVAGIPARLIGSRE